MPGVPNHAGTCFNGQTNILSEDYIAGLEIGAPLQDDEQNPLVGGSG